jgi:hypothetical protein
LQRAVAAALAGLATALCLPATASALVQQHCAAPPSVSVQQQDRLLRFAAFIKSTLDASGQRLAIVARAGLDLSRFGLRYSHGGISLRDSPSTPWSVRQLYYDCEQGQPRLFDQGVPGFLLGADDPATGWFSAVLVPAPAGVALAAHTLDRSRALQALHPHYSANAHAWSLRYQNCNQWLVETLALAWGPGVAGVPDIHGEAPAPATDHTAHDATARTPPRAAAQAWLREVGYQPQVLTVSNRPLMWLASALPWLHEDDHPADDLAAAQYRVSMPTSVEAFVRQREPAAERLEFCHNGQHMLLRRGWRPIADGCVAEPGDERVPF